MTEDPRLIRLELENQIAAAHAFIGATEAVRARYGTSVDTIAGLTVPTCAVWDYPLFNRVIGAGILGPLDDDGIAAVVRHFAVKGRSPCVEVLTGVTPPALIEALGRAGFTDSGHGVEVHVLETDRPVEAPVPGVEVHPVTARDRRRFGEAVRDGFGMAGTELGAFFVDLTEASLHRLGDDGAAYLATVDGHDAGTGQLVCTDAVAGCYSGSVLEPFRGRGIQKVLIAARIADGLRRGRRIFISQTDPDSPSGHNLHDLGFRTLYRATWFTRPA